MALEFNEDKLDVTNICVSIDITQEYALLGFPRPILHFFLNVIDYSENTKNVYIICVDLSLFISQIQ